MLDEFDSNRWAGGLELISLDFTRPIYSKWAIEVEAEETLRGLIRDILLNRLPLLEEQYCVVRAGGNGLEFPALSERVRRVVGAALGFRNLAKVEHWIKYIANVEEDNPWVHYEEVFASWSSVLRRTGIDQFEFRSAPSVLNHYGQVGSEVEACRTLLTMQTSRFLSDWDFQRFVVVGLLEIPSDSDFFPFVDLILLTFRMARFQSFWRWLSVYISGDERNNIDQAALRLFDNKKVPFISSEHLPVVSQ